MQSAGGVAQESRTYDDNQDVIATLNDLLEISRDGEQDDTNAYYAAEVQSVLRPEIRLHVLCKPGRNNNRRAFAGLGRGALMMSDMLTELGFHVIGPFGRVADAMAAVGREDFHAAVLDVNHPVADAVVARGVPFVFVTGHGAEGIDGRFAQVLLLQKPIEIQMLQRAFFFDGGQRVGQALRRYPNI